MKQNEIRDVDVAVLGGGPAGSAVALELLNRGYSTVVIERSDYSGTRIGETLPPAIQPLLVSLGIWDQFLAEKHSPAFGIGSAWGRADLYENDFIFNPYGHGWHIDRARFDAMLALAAEEAGAKMYRGAQLVSSAQDSSGGWEIEIGSLAEPRHYRTRFLIDASGRAASFARKQGAQRIAFDHLIGVVAFLSANAPQPPADSRTLVEAVEQGWWYSARLPDSQLVVAYMTDADLYTKRNRNPVTYWQEQLQQAPHTHVRAKDYSIKTGPLIFAANSSRLDLAAGRNWVAVGDAAMAFDPLSSQGVCQALASGLRAAGLIQDHLKGGETALPIYAQSLNQSFENYLNARDQYYGREKRWPHSIFWQRRHTSRHAKL